MRQSRLFTKTRREAPKDEVAKNARLLIRGGFVHKEMAGVYDLLPLGLRTFNKIIGIIREEMNAIGGQEVFLTSLQDPAPWKASGRWDDSVVDVWFKTKLASGGEVGLANTHEEALVALMCAHIHSYRDLPAYVYQFQTKFRNELRAKSGIMRTREFVMKDLYSFNTDEADFRAFYERCAHAYKNIFERVGIGGKTYRTFASGGSFSKFSDEFQTVCDAGEDTIYVHDGKGIAINEEVLTDEVVRDLGIKRADLRKERAIEVGNIFPLGTKYSSVLNLTYKDVRGNDVPVFMGSYGIGPARVMGTIAEMLADDHGLVWPKSVAPFSVHLVDLSQGDTALKESAEGLYRALTDAGVDVLFDDRDVRAGEKFADADLIGIPVRASVGARAGSGNVEVQNRAGGEPRVIPARAFVAECRV